MTKFKVVLDTNVYVSALIFGGVPKQVFNTIFKGSHELYVSEYILFEISQTIKQKFDFSHTKLDQVLEKLKNDAMLIQPKHSISRSSHQNDNRILECAVTADADFLITGDKKHLLSIGTIKSTKIITPRQFIQEVHN
jgi:putative PIN family toxin of toxin-antitoxin system